MAVAMWLVRYCYEALNLTHSLTNDLSLTSQLTYPG